MNISQRLRTCAKHTGLDSVIELLQEAADEIDALQARAQVQGEPVAWMASYVDPIGNDHVYVTSHHDLAVENDMHGTPRPLYTHPAPSVPADVVRDAERYRWLREHGIMGFTGAPGWLVTVAFEAMDAHAQTLDSNIGAAMLAAK